MRTGHGRQRLRLSEAGFEANAGCRDFHLDFRCGYREETFPGAIATGQDAPLADLDATAFRLPQATSAAARWALRTARNAPMPTLVAYRDRQLRGGNRQFS